MIIGQATVCWYVQVQNEVRVVKSLWAVTLCQPTKEWLLQRAHKKKVRYIPEVLEMSDVYVNGKVDSTEMNRGVYQGSKVVDCTHRRILFKELSRTHSACPTYNNGRPRLSVIRERPRWRPCATASGIAIEIPLHVPNREVWRRTPCERSREPRYRRRA